MAFFSRLSFAQLFIIGICVHGRKEGRTLQVIMKYSNDSSLIFSNGCSVTCVVDDFNIIEDGVCSENTENAILDKEKCLYEVFRQPGRK